MLTEARETEVEAAVLLGLAGGLRVAEVVAITWSDIDLGTGRITVGRSWWGKTKSGRSRSFTLPASTVASLRHIKMRQAETLLAVGVRADESTHVVTKRTGEAMNPRQLSNAFAAFCEDYGYTVTFHGLRHSNAVMLLTQGVDVKTAADRLGHDPAVLLRTYAHFIPSADRAAAERLDAALA
jgi:integrase